MRGIPIPWRGKGWKVGVRGGGSFAAAGPGLSFEALGAACEGDVQVEDVRGLVQEVHSAGKEIGGRHVMGRRTGCIMQSKGIHTISAKNCITMSLPVCIQIVIIKSTVGEK